MPTVTTNLLRKYEETYDMAPGLSDRATAEHWWFCQNWIDRLWHIPETATKFWIKFSTRPLAGSYKVQLGQQGCELRNPWQLAFRLLDGKVWHRLNETTAMEGLFEQFKITDKPKTVWVQLLYEE